MSSWVDFIGNGREEEKNEAKVFRNGTQLGARLETAS